MSGEETACCGKCGTSAQVTWCPAWQVYLCTEHLFERTYKELDATGRPDRWAMAQARDVTVTLR